MHVTQPVHNSTVLDICTGPYTDPVHVSAKDSVHPNTAVLTDLDITDYLSAVVDECRDVYSRKTRGVGPKHQQNYTLNLIGPLASHRSIGAIMD